MKSVFVIALALFVTACGDAADSKKKKAGEVGDSAAESAELEKLLQAAVKPRELIISDVSEGTGEVVAEGDKVKVKCTGYLASDLEIFWSSFDQGEEGIEFTIGNNGVIAGWVEGVPGMKVGGVRKLYIPSDKAYGAAGSSASPGRPAIPAHADLIFVIELQEITVKVEKPKDPGAENLEETKDKKG